ncbi:MAG: hypothetical protein PW845_02145 [Pseudomonas sp.]|uniref:hypothetical protein n=1 Tax=Pseudomonas abieticivorans TaxID=2931382 RepID=UPI0020BE2F23|nr:hypothetical protein [Pseudomonas sp. PIA16]MDE1164194.1 hypothetical protein [Pseudomonas sp.]
MTQTTTPESPEVAEDAAPAPPAVDLPWADVTPEQFKMLRLVPLPVDRATGARPLRFVQLGRAERHSTHFSLLRLDIQLPAQKVRKEQNHLDVWANHDTQTITFSPDSGLHMEPLNRGLGRFLLAQAAIWLQRKWSHYRIEGGTLAAKDALGEDARLRRDHVLKTHGIEVSYTDAQHMKGSYKELTAGNLIATWNGEKIQPVEILDAATMLQLADHNLQEQEVKLRQQEERVAKFKREDGGLRFTISCLVAFAVFQAGLLIWIATHR